MCALLKTIELHFSVISNEQIKIYSDPELTNEVPAYYLGEIPRGVSRTATMYVKNFGEPVTVAVSANTPYAIVEPAQVDLGIDAVVQVDITVTIPYDAPIESFDGQISFESIGA